MFSSTARCSGQTACRVRPSRSQDVTRHSERFVSAVGTEATVHSFWKNTLISCCLIIWRQGAPNHPYFLISKRFLHWCVINTSMLSGHNPASHFPKNYHIFIGKMYASIFTQVLYLSTIQRYSSFYCVYISGTNIALSPPGHLFY